MSFKKIAAWCDQYLLLFLATFLLVFIPLYPKIPLFEAIPGYVVRVRLEDVVVFVTMVVWLVQVVRGKVAWKSLVAGWQVLYLGAGLLSLLAAVFLLQSIPFELLHIGKSALHLFRYLEYFLLFFFFFAAIKEVKQAKIVALVLALVVMAATVYGFGQKYLHWPLYSTMNREYSKGQALYLMEFARVQSTFAGHYDLSAFLVLVLPIIFALSLKVKSRRLQIGLHFTHVLGIWLMAVGASKTSFAAYGLAIVVVMGLSFWGQKKIKQPAWLGVGLAVFFLGFLGSMVVFFGGDSWQMLKNVYTNLRHPQVAEESVEVVTKPKDLYYDAPKKEQIATVSAEGKEVVVTIETENTWSENAIKYGLSMGIRLDTLWPQAIRGFVRNPLTGTGYATLSKNKDAQFTEAESTDNNFLRALGETGLLGFIAFFGLVIWVLKISFQNRVVKDPVAQALTIGFFGGAIGLLANGLYLDVFLASKVAFTFWAVAGVVTKVYYLEHPKLAQQLDAARFNHFLHKLQKHWPFILTAVILFLLVHKQPFFDFGWVRSLEPDPLVTSHLTAVECLLSDSATRLCLPQHSQLWPMSASPIYVLWLIPFYLLHHDPNMFYFANLILSLVSLGIFYKLLQKMTDAKELKIAALSAYVVWPALSLVPSLPLAENLLLPFILLLISLLFAARTKKKIFFMLAVGVMIILSLPSNTDYLGYILLPVTTLLMIWGIETKLNIIWPAWMRWQRFAAVLVLVFVGWSFIGQGRVGQILDNFRQTTRYWRFHAVRRLNTYFTEREVPAGEVGLPMIITALNPFYVNLYAEPVYSLLPISARQAFFNQAKQIWGDHDYSDLLQVYQQEMDQGRSVWATNFDIGSNQLYEEWQKLRDGFDLEVRSFDCEYDCNIYQLHPSTPLTFGVPVSLNARSLPDLSPEGYSFVVYSHRFSPPPESKRYSVLDFLPKINLVSRLQPDFLVLMGDPVHRAEASHAQVFNESFADQVEYPIYYVAGNYDLLPKKIFPTYPQGFRTQSELFLTINAAANGAVNDQQKMFLLNTLEKARKDQHLKTIFIFDHRLSWLSSEANLAQMAAFTNQGMINEEDDFLVNQFLPRLREMTDKKVYYISGDVQSQARPGVFYHPDDDSNLIYVAAAVNNQEGDAFLKIEVGADSQIQIMPYDQKAQLLQTIDSYDL